MLCRYWGEGVGGIWGVGCVGSDGCCVGTEYGWQWTERGPGQESEPGGY